MNSEKLSVDTVSSDVIAATKDKESRLLKFDDDKKVSPGRDINTKITALDTDLAHLRSELGAINNSVEEGLDRLSDTDTDLTAKVSETYKRLGEIDNAYKSLLDISTRIDTDIQKLNGDVSTVAEQSATGIKTLEQSTIAQSNEFSDKNQKVVSKVNQLVETSKLTGELLSQKIHATTEKMLLIETQVVAEIETLSSTTRVKTDAIEVSVNSNKARILKLQSVDEAIIKRATSLEITSAELTVKSQDIQASVELLQLITNNLSTGLQQLKEKTRALEDVTANHGSLINSLQKASYELTDKLTGLAVRENKHFNIFTVSFLLLLVVTATIFFTQQSQFDANDIKIAEQSVVVDNRIASLQATQSVSAAATNTSISDLETKVSALNAAVKVELDKEVALIDNKIQTMQDQVQSVDARLTSSSPFSQLGDDNIIHGAQWIAGLPAQNFTVQLAYVSDRSTMYELAQRYNYYLKTSLSYFEVHNKNASGVSETKYVLLSGNYATPQQAMAQLQSMPRYIDMQRPVVQKIGDVQKYIASSAQ